MNDNVNNNNGAVLVTGATGFIGGHVCTHLQEQGYLVRAAVRRRAALPAEWRQVEVGDIGPQTAWGDALAGADAVVHLASYSPSPRAGAKEIAAAYRRVTLEGSIALAQAAAASGVRRFIYISTIKVNGEQTPIDVPYTAKTPPRPEDVYGRSKWQAEQALREIADETGLELIILRLPIVYGPGVRGNFLALLRLVERGLPVPLGSVRNRRSMLYVKNLADAIHRALAAPLPPSRTYLLSDDHDLSTPELIRRIASHMHRRVRLWPVPVGLLRAAGTLAGKRGVVHRLTGSLAVDARPFCDDFAWSPPYSVDQALAETVDWYLQRSRSA